MPGTRRPPAAVWNQLRKIVWARDGRRCARCEKELAEKEVSLDRIEPTGGNKAKNLRPLCRRCYVLRVENLPLGLTAKAIADGVIPPDWRPLVWEG